MKLTDSHIHLLITLKYKSYSIDSLSKTKYILFTDLCDLGFMTKTDDRYTEITDLGNMFIDSVMHAVSRIIESKTL